MITRRILSALSLGVAATLVAAAAFANPSGGGGSQTETRESTDRRDRSTDEASLAYQRGMELVDEGRFGDALARFRQAHKKRKNDPEILNMIAYCHRKTGNLEDAFEHYRKAIGIRPRFPEAREYLGEAYIQAALLQIEILRGYGDEGAAELADLVAALRNAAETLEAEPPGGAGRTPEGADW